MKDTALFVVGGGILALGAGLFVYELIKNSGQAQSAAQTGQQTATQTGAAPTLSPSTTVTPVVMPSTTSTPTATTSQYGEFGGLKSSQSFSNIGGNVYNYAPATQNIYAPSTSTTDTYAPVTSLTNTTTKTSTYAPQLTYSPSYSSQSSSYNLALTNIKKSTTLKSSSLLGITGQAGGTG